MKNPASGEFYCTECLEKDVRRCISCGICLEDTPKWHKECRGCFRKCTSCYSPLGDVPSYYKKCKECYVKDKKKTCASCSVLIEDWKTYCYSCYKKNMVC